MNARRSPVDSTTRSSSGLWYALLGMFLCLLGFGSYILFIDQYWIRTWGIPCSVLLCLGTFLAWMSTTRRPRWLGFASAMFCTLLTGLFLFGMYVMKLPPAVGPTDSGFTLGALPGALLDHSGVSVGPSDLVGKGPTLLVFYRGHW